MENYGNQQNQQTTNDDWNKSDSGKNPEWDFSINPVCEGIYIQRKQLTIKGREAELVVVRVNTPSGQQDYTVWLNKVLQGRFDHPDLRIGCLVRVQFLGWAQPPGGNKYKNYDMLWKPANITVHVNGGEQNFNQQPVIQPQVQQPVYQQPVVQQAQPVYQQPVIQQQPVVQPQVQQQNFQQVPVNTGIPQIDPRFPQLPPPPAGYKYNDQGQLIQDIPF